MQCSTHILGQTLLHLLGDDADDTDLDVVCNVTLVLATYNDSRVGGMIADCDADPKLTINALDIHSLVADKFRNPQIAKFSRQVQVNATAVQNLLIDYRNLQRRNSDW